MLKIGLTGGIGSGKTVVSDTFGKHGVTVIDTDVIAREVLINNGSLLKTLSETFGSDILDESKQLIRPKLRDRAFKDSTSKALLDSIMHPVIRQATLKKIKLTEDQDKPYCIIVVPLLIETGFIKLVDRVLVVTAPHERKLQWLEKRSQLDQERAEKIMSTQSSDMEKLKISDDHIHNDSDIQSIQNQVKELHQKYLLLSKPNT